MARDKKLLLYNIFALTAAIWFLLTGWIWNYFACLFISYPVAVVGIILWNKARKRDKDSFLNKVILILFIIGLLSSFGSVFIYL